MLSDAQQEFHIHSRDLGTVVLCTQSLLYDADFMSTDIQTRLCAIHCVFGALHETAALVY